MAGRADFLQPSDAAAWRRRSGRQAPMRSQAAPGGRVESLAPMGPRPARREHSAVAKLGIGGPMTATEQLWPADKVERWAVSRLIPYARNARTHSDAQVAQIAASIREWGWTTPVLVDEAGGLIAGHGRVMAARKLGIAEVPVMVARGWSEAQKRAYVLADNKLALNAGWDEELLRVELADLRGDGRRPVADRLRRRRACRRCWRTAPRA